MKPAEIYKSREEQFKSSYNQLKKRHNFISTVRLIFFMLTLAMVIYFLNVQLYNAVILLTLLFPIPFGLLVKYHQRIGFLRDLNQHLTNINATEQKVLQGDFSAYDDGKEFLDQKHPYINDLDIFGNNSVYQLLNRTNTPSGRISLSSWLTKLFSKETIEQRQDAVIELAPKIDWRQNFQALGMTNKKEKENFKGLLNWIDEPNIILRQSLMAVLAKVLPLITILLIFLNIFAGLSFYFTVAVLFINGYLLKRYAKHIQDLTERSYNGVKTLRAYGDLIQEIEQASFNSVLLNEVQYAFKHDAFSASGSIKSLQKILDFLLARGNMFYQLFNFLFLLDLQLLFMAEKWKANKHDDVILWFEKIGEIEALNSLANLAYNNPDYTFGEIISEPFQFQTTGLGHPLIKSEERINNDFSFNGKGSVAIITGSNMSGKSTFLRTIGVNLILCYAGAPVCAQTFKASIMQVFTSMRTQDNLEEHVSSFYAELRRIKMLLEYVENDTPVMYMLDEILKGTNSRDRHQGAAALVKQLSATNSCGFVSTHDLELGKLTDQMNNVTNFSFNSDIKDDEILFDYKLTQGVCHSFNASKLMEQIGIKMEE